MKNIVHRARLVALLGASLFAMAGCGSSVSPTGLPRRYQAVVAAGYCRLTPFCVEQRPGMDPRFYGFRAAGFPGACSSSDIDVNTPIADAITKDGQVTSLFCYSENAAVTATTPPTDNVGVTGTDRPPMHGPLPCFFPVGQYPNMSIASLSQQLYSRAFGDQFTASQFEAFCPSGFWDNPDSFFGSSPFPRSCARNFGMSGGTGPDLSAASWARMLTCRKSMSPPSAGSELTLDPTVAPHTGMTAAQMDDIARRYWGAMAHSYSEIAALNANFTISPGNELSDTGPTARVRYIAFARPTPARFPFVTMGPQQARLRDPDAGTLDHNSSPLEWDPSIHPLGYTFDIDPAGSTATVEELANPSNSSNSPVLGIASALIHQASGHAEVSLLQAELKDSVTFNGQTIRNGRLNLTSNWFGTVAGTSTSTAANAAPMQIQFDVGSDHYARNVTAASTIVGTFTTGTNPVYELDSTFVESGMKFIVHLRLVGRKRPVAAITSHAASPSAYTTECTSPAGATVSLAGAGYDVAGSSSWRFLWSGGGLTRSGSTASVQLPLLLPTSAPVDALFDYRDNASAHFDTDRRLLRVVDSTPPSVSSTVVSPPCGFGIQQPSQNSVIFNTCAPITGLFSDTCSTNMTVSIKKVRMYAYPSNAFLGEQTPQSNCILVHPSYVNGSLSAVDYEVEYTAVDSWGNQSPIRKWRGYFWGGGATGTCSAPAIAATLLDQ